MSDKKLTQPDSFGRHWVYVTEAEIRSHKKGHFGTFIWLVCLWFICVGGLEVILGANTTLVRLFFGVLLFFTGVGLCVRKRFAYLLALLFHWFLLSDFLVQQQAMVRFQLVHPNIMICVML